VPNSERRPHCCLPQGQARLGHWSPGKGSCSRSPGVIRRHRSRCSLMLPAQHETRVVFDRPIDPVHLKNLAQQSAWSWANTRPRTEVRSLSGPGYQVVKDQEDVPRLLCRCCQPHQPPTTEPLCCKTAARTESCNYAVTIPTPLAQGPGKPNSPHLRHKMTWISFPTLPAWKRSDRPG